jgi:hypothetical protein
LVRNRMKNEGCKIKGNVQSSAALPFIFHPLRARCSWPNAQLASRLASRYRRYSRSLGRKP